MPKLIPNVLSNIFSGTNSKKNDKTNSELEDCLLPSVDIEVLVYWINQNKLQNPSSFTNTQFVFVVNEGDVKSSSKLRENSDYLF